MTIAPTTTLTGGSGVHAGATPAAAPKQTLDKEVFLALLVAQLRNQDPSSPMDTNEMMAQSSQLASMEQLTSLAETSRESFALQMRIAAGGLVGQEVTFTDADGITRTGTAEQVSFAGAVPIVTVGQWTVPLDGVTTLAARSAASSPASAPSAPSAQTSSTQQPAQAATSTEGN